VSAGSADPAGILPTTLFATCVSTTAAFIAVKLFQRFSVVAPAGTLESAPAPGVAAAETASAAPGAAADGETADTAGSRAGQGVPPNDEIVGEAAAGAYPLWVSVVSLTAIVALIPLAVVYGETISPWVIPSLMAGLIGFGAARRVRVYEAFVEGARDGFQVALRIIPYLVAILVAVAMLRASGALDMLVGALAPITGPIGLPAEALPMALMRPLSGSGAFGILASTIQDPAIGPDSYTGYLVSTFQGSTETTFYVLAVYYGAVQVRRIRHTLAAALVADVAGVAGAVIACSYLFGGR
jgi:spore maturation protein SpmB